MSARLDYAYLADYAAVENGRLTAVGASFTHMQVPDLPSSRPVTVAGRVKVPAGAEGYELGVAIKAPEGEWEINFNGHVPAGEAREYDGKKGLLFAAQALLTFTRPGLHVVEVRLDDVLVRTLKFDVLVAS
jgi:hypothetical protein